MVNNCKSDDELIREVRKLISDENKYFVERNRNLHINYEEEYHSEVIDPDGKKRNMLDEREKFLANTKEVTSFLAECKPGKILDFGCGLGWFLSVLNDNWDKHGFEVSNFASNFASQFGKIFNNQIEFYNESNFDVVIMYHVIEHLTDPHKTLLQIKEKMKKGAKIIIGTPDFDSIAARTFEGNFRLIKDPGHISLFSTDSLSRLLRNLDFRIIDIQYPYFDTSWCDFHAIEEIHSPTKQISPPFYGSVVTFFCEKK